MNSLFNALRSLWRPPAKAAVTVDGILAKAGWHSGRVCDAAMGAFERTFGASFHPKAREFVSSYGNLILHHSLSTYCGDMQGPHPISEFSASVGCQACPVGESNYKSSQAVLWLDEDGKFYVEDERDVWFIASTTTRAFEVLFLKAPRESELFFSLSNPG